MLNGIITGPSTSTARNIPKTHKHIRSHKNVHVHVQSSNGHYCEKVETILTDPTEGLQPHAPSVTQEVGGRAKTTNLPIPVLFYHDNFPLVTTWRAVKGRKQEQINMNRFVFNMLKAYCLSNMVLRSLLSFLSIFRWKCWGSKNNTNLHESHTVGKRNWNSNPAMLCFKTRVFPYSTMLHQTQKTICSVNDFYPPLPEHLKIHGSSPGSPPPLQP